MGGMSDTALSPACRRPSPCCFLKSLGFRAFDIDCLAHFFSGSDNGFTPLVAGHLDRFVVLHRHSYDIIINITVRYFMDKLKHNRHISSFMRVCGVNRPLREELEVLIENIHSPLSSLEDYPAF
jgi:hypothetical protein